MLVGGPKGQLDFLSVAGYSKLGLPGTMVPNPSTTGNFIDSTFGLRFHTDSAHLRGIKARTGASAMANTNGTVIPALSQNDTNTNPHNPMYGIYQFGARGGLLDLIGSHEFDFGRQFDGAADHGDTERHAGEDLELERTARAWSTPGSSARCCRMPADVTNVMESMKRISDAKYGSVTRLCGCDRQCGGQCRHADLRLHQGRVHRRHATTTRPR